MNRWRAHPALVVVPRHNRTIVALSRFWLLLVAFGLTLVLSSCSVSQLSRTTSAAGADVSASVSNSAPVQHSPVTVAARLVIRGQPIANVPMIAIWHYKTTTPSCTGTTDASGGVSCTRYIGGATQGYPVKISIRFAWNNQTYKAETSFTPR